MLVDVHAVLRIYAFVAVPDQIGFECVHIQCLLSRLGSNFPQFGLLVSRSVSAVWIGVSYERRHRTAEPVYSQVEKTIIGRLPLVWPRRDEHGDCDAYTA